MTDNTIRCEEALRLLAQFLDGELAEKDTDAVQRHVDTCRSCYSRAEFETQLKGKLRELHSCDIEPGFETRIRGLIHRFADETRAE